MTMSSCPCTRATQSVKVPPRSARQLCQSPSSESVSKTLLVWLTDGNTKRSLGGGGDHLGVLSCLLLDPWNTTWYERFRVLYASPCCFRWPPSRLSGTPRAKQSKKSKQIGSQLHLHLHRHLHLHLHSNVAWFLRPYQLFDARQLTLLRTYRYYQHLGKCIPEANLVPANGQSVVVEVAVEGFTKWRCGGSG